MEDLKATGQIAGEHKPRPIQLVIALLSEMTERATAAERERDEQKERADEWYRHYCTKNAMCQDLQKKLTAEIEEHRRTKEALKEAKRQKLFAPAAGKLNTESERGQTNG